MAPLSVPIDLLRWIDEHIDEFRPPVSNKVVWTERDFIFMVIRGPNARSDFHVNPTDEIFWQIRGTIRVDSIVDDTVTSTLVAAGEIMLVPAGTPHSPRRPPDSWGVVIERPRDPGDLDSLLWRCEDCATVLSVVEFALDDIEIELPRIIQEFNDDETRRRCSRCGTLAPVPGPFRLDANG